MDRFKQISVAVFLATFLVSASDLPAAFLRFQWQDNEGDKGEFVIDTAKGVSTDAFLSFSYIDYHGNPTPPGHLPKSWRLYDEDHVWDINPDLEGIVSSFSQPVGEPLPEDPAYYEDHFEKSVYLAEPGMRTWEHIKVTRTFGNITLMKADPNRPDVIYAIDFTNPGEGPCHLLRIKASTGKITDFLEIGLNATDFDIDPTTDRLYVANFKQDHCQVVDLATFAPLEPIPLGNIIRCIEADGRGHLYTEGKNYGQLLVWDLKTLENSPLPVSLSPGDLELGPDARFLYHASGAHDAIVTKIDLSSNPPSIVARSISQDGFASRRLLVAANGSKVAFGNYVFDADLRFLDASAADPAQSISPGGELICGAENVRWADGGAEVFALPTAAEHAVFSSDGTRLVLLDPLAHALRSIAVSDIAELPGPWPRPGQSLAESPDSFSWPPTHDATSYTLVIDGAPGGTLRFENIPSPSFVLPDPLPFGRNYAWKVVATTPGGDVTGITRHFSISFPQAPAVAASNQTAIKSLSIGHDFLLVANDDNTTHLYGFDPQTGATEPFHTFTENNQSSGQDYGRSVALTDAAAFVGAPDRDEKKPGQGVFFEHRRSTTGYFLRNKMLTAPSPAAQERFGYAMAASGDMLLVGTNTSSSLVSPGRVVAYLTRPSTAETQILRPDDSKSGDGFGKQVAMDGNTAVIAAPNRRNSYKCTPSIYIFSRDTATGQWKQSQRLDPPTQSAWPFMASSIVLSGNIIAVNNTTDHLVYIFARNAPDGDWKMETTIERSDVPGSSESQFGVSVALTGETLFIGDSDASCRGIPGGVVFPFHRDGNRWIPGPPMTPEHPTRRDFGAKLSARDGWLLVGGNAQFGAPTLWLFATTPSPNHTPRFTSDAPVQAVSGLPFEATVVATDPDGPEGLTIEALQLPDWLSLADEGNGRATLSGTPTASPGTTFDVQLKVSDPAGASGLQTSRLTLLSESDKPSIVSHPTPENLDLGVGQELVLRGEAEGVGPITWQWQRNGTDIPGANQPLLDIADVSLADAGAYTFTVSNAVATVVSKPATVAVHPANRFAGPWETFGNSARHTGFHPATLGRHRFVQAWQTVPYDEARPLHRPAIGEGRVFLTPVVHTGGSYSGLALDLATGEPQWSHPFAEAFSINPPTYHNGRIYIQRSNQGTDTQLWCLDARSGETAWKAPHGAQWAHYKAPAVTNYGVWINGGGSGGLCGFELDGTQRFFYDLEQYDQWTPTVSNKRLFSWVAGFFREHNPMDGTILWSLDVGWKWHGFSMNTVCAVSGNSAAVLSSTKITCIDIDQHTIRWQHEVAASGSPAIADGTVFAIVGDQVRTWDLENGTSGPAFQAPETLASEQPLLLNDYLIVASNSSTFVFDRNSTELVQTLSGGGKLAYSGGYLLATGTEGKLRAYFANAAPAFDDTMPTRINAGDAAGDMTLPLGEHASDPDPGDTLAWAIVSVSNNEIFRTLEIDADTGDLTVIYNPWQSGTSEVTVSATDPAGNITEHTITFFVPPHPAPQIDVADSLVLNHQTGLYEHTITITNTGAREIAGFDLTVANLPEGVCVWNASDCTKGPTTIQHRQVVAAGESATLVLEYYAKARGTKIEPTVTAALVTKPESDPAAPDGGFAIDRAVRLADGSMLVEFTAVPGTLYELHYSPDGEHWKLSPIRIRAAGNRVQWIDRGPPRTDVPPNEALIRFYRVKEISNNN